MRLNNSIIWILLSALIVFFVFRVLFDNPKNSLPLKKSFVEVIKKSGISSAPSQGGVSWHDYNSDGYLDLIAREQGKSLRLYRNNQNETFTDVTSKTGLPLVSDAKSAIFGDYDNDGCPDLYMSNFSMDDLIVQSAVLYRNNCDGTFSDVSEKAGMINNYHSRGVAWGDYNNDGFLDLYVATFGSLKFAKSATKWGLVDWLPEPNILYRNNGDGTFTNVVKETGITGLALCTKNKTEQYPSSDKPNDSVIADETLTGLLAKIKNNWQPVWFDYDNDGLQDLYITHETTINSLYHNDGDGTFTDVTQKAGLCMRHSNHGVAIGDYDNDGYLDIYATGSRHNIFWHNNRDGTFKEVSEYTGTRNAVFLGWGVGALDFNNDGNLDIYSINGTAKNPDVRYSYPSKKDRLYKNIGQEQFIEVAEEEGIFGDDAKSTGAFGDFNNDGFTDVFVISDTSLNRSPVFNRLYKNIPNDNHWLTVKLVGTTSNRDGIGARIILEANKKIQIREVISGESLMSQNSIWQTFGLGSQKNIDKLIIKWPSGKTQILLDIKPDQLLTITEE